MDRGVHRLKEIDGSSSSSSPCVNHIEHRVTKMDTLAGVAIKYGVEIADIRRLNGLVMDLQMFAHESLQIPLPGRHPPSPILSNGSTTNGCHSIGDCDGRISPCGPLNDILDSFQSLKPKPPQGKVSPAMSSLQGYYGLTTPKRAFTTEGTEMAGLYKMGLALDFEEEAMESYPRISEPFTPHHRKSKSLVAGFTDLKVVGETEDSTDIERSIRRRQKADPSVRTSESVLKEEMSGVFSGRTRKNFAPRPKSGSRTDMDMARLNPHLIGDPLPTDGLVSVRKSSSTSNLEESEKMSSIWPTSRWRLKPDFISREIFDFPKPMTNRRNKAALD